MSKYTGVDLAPYWRVRPSPFYDQVFLNGTYTADIQGCNWVCENCWSGYGWKGLALEDRPRSQGGGEFTSVEIAKKLLAGMERNAQPMCRISGGEASMYWDPHMIAVIREVITQTTGFRLHVEGATPPEGDVMGICIETNGGTITKGQLRDLEDEFGPEAGRIVIAVGVKATDAAKLAQLTGMPEATCDRFHRNQMDLLRYLATEAKYLGWFANFLDAFTDPEDFAALQRKFERARPGQARLMDVDPYRPGMGKGNRRGWTPKRFRTAGEHFNEPGAEVDEEIIMDERGKGHEIPDKPQPAHDPNTVPPPHVEAMRELEAATEDRRAARG